MPNPTTDKKTSPITLTVIILALLVAGGLRIQQAFELRKVNWADLGMRGQVFQVEVADTDAKRELGLGKRDSLAPNHGMYFPFPTAQYWVFWMKDMRFPIDIVWIQDGTVVDISPDVPVDPGLPLKTYSPIAPADAVLELNAGDAARIGLKDGDPIVLGAPGSNPTVPTISEAPAPQPVDSASN